MPKISAPTVAQHREAQRLALLRAAEAILLEGGVSAVSAKSVGERAGLARSSFYEYFASRDDLLAAVAIEAFDAWSAETDRALEAAEPGLDRLRAYVDATMRMTADGSHKIASSLRQAELSPSSYDDIMALHDKLLAPVSAVLSDLGIVDPHAHAVLVQGVLNAGMQLVEHGVAAEIASRRVYDLLAGGLAR